MADRALRALSKLLVLPILHPVITLVISAVLSAVAVIYTINCLGLQTSQKDLISPRERLIQIAGQYEQFEQLDSFVVVIESKSRSRSLQFLRTLAPLVEKNKTKFQQVFYRINPDLIKPWALLYLDKKEISDIVKNLLDNRDFLHDLAKEPTLVNFFGQINREMSTTIVGEVFTGFLKEASEKKQPLDLDFLVRVLSEMRRSLAEDQHFISPWNSLLATTSMDITEEGYFWTKDKHYLLMFVTPVKEIDFAGSLKSIQELRRYVSLVRADFPDVSAGVTGPEALNVDQMSTALADMQLATVLSVIGLTILFIIFRRSIRRPVFELLTLIAALSWSFGLTTLFIGHLNILSITFAPLLLGLGIDFGAHWFARYQEEEIKSFSSKEELLRTTTDRIGPGIVLAGTNLAISFLPLTFTGFKGLAELGLICFMGMIMMTAASLFVLPSLAALFDRPRSKPGPERSFNSEHVAPFMRLFPRRIIVILAISGIAMALAAWNAREVRFDLNMLNLQSPGIESVVWEHRLLESSDVSSIFGQMLAPTLDGLRQKAKHLEKLPTVAKVESILDLLPSNQEEKLRQLRQLRPVLAGIDFSRMHIKPVDTEALDNVLGRIRFKMLDSDSPGISKKLREQMIQVKTLIEQIRSVTKSERNIARRLGLFQYSLIQDLDEKLKTLQQNIKATPMTFRNLPQPLLERFMTRDGRFLIRVYPRGVIWEPAVLGEFVTELRSVDPDVAGDPVTLYVFTREFRDSTIVAAFYAIVFMFVFLLVVFRKVKSTVLALIPLLIGTVWIFGLMPALGIDLNLANSIFLPLIVGHGVEYGVIIVFRWRQRERDKPAGVVLPRSTALGVILAGLTTTIGFGSLMISSHRGIFSLGLLSAIGSVTVLAAAIVFLPAILEIVEMEKRGGNI